MKDHHRMRAWDKVQKKYVSSLEYQKIILEIQGRDDDASPHLDNCFWYPEWVAERFDHEQCSGCKDKNGTLIYEKDYLFDGTKTLIVCFSNGRFCFDGKEDEQIIWEDVRRFYKKVGTVHEGTTEYLIKSQRRYPAKTTNL